MKNSTVSVVMPVLDSADAIEASVHSVAQQGIDHLELLIIDNGSCDGSVDVIKLLCAKYPFLHFLQQPIRGADAARNLGIEAATGRYIAFLDSDDLWLPGKLQAQISFMRSEQVAFSYGDYAIHQRADDQWVAEHRTPDKVTYRDLLWGCPIGCLTAAYDQEALGKVYMPSVRRGQDWGLWLALTRIGGPARKYPGMHAVYRHGGESLSANKFAKLRDVYNIYRQQEGLGRVVTSVYLARHAVSALIKRP